MSASPPIFERTGKVEPMQIPLRPCPRESTEAMVRNIARELGEIEQAISRCRGSEAEGHLQTAAMGWGPKALRCAGACHW
jgi:hypothetical protein